MSEQRKIDLKKHQLPPVSKKYLIRIVVYIIMLTVLGFAIKYLYSNQQTDSLPNTEQIDDFTLELPE